MSSPVTLITGTSKGIGRHLAEHYLARGHRVIGVSRGESPIAGSNYLHCSADVTDEPAVLKLCERIRREFGGLDHLINNAGIAAMNHALLTPVSTLRKILDVNVAGTFLFSREAAKIMQRAKRGRIVNFSTVAVALDLEGEAAYVASKAAVEALTRVMAREVATYGITVNAVGPVPIDTDLIRAVPKPKIDALVQRQAIKRLGTFDDVTNVVDFYLDPRSAFVTGQVLYLGGV
jgi:3-oxoacyl-[acyl-carrier protein] reductase